MFLPLLIETLTRELWVVGHRHWTEQMRVLERRRSTSPEHKTACATRRKRIARSRYRIFISSEWKTCGNVSQKKKNFSRTSGRFRGNFSPISFTLRRKLVLFFWVFFGMKWSLHAVLATEDRYLKTWTKISEFEPLRPSSQERAHTGARSWQSMSELLKVSSTL